MHKFDNDLKVFGIRHVLDEIQEAIDMSKSMEESSCKKGCSFCCHTSVDITEAEALLLKKHIPSSKLNILAVQARHNKENWNEMPYHYRRCVFLENGECSVYENRPARCRNYFVKSDPKKCNTQYKVKITTVIAPIKPSIMIDALSIIQPVGVMAAMLLKPRQA